MPFLLISGRPASGKTYRANQIIAFLKETRPEVEVVLLNTETFSLDRNTARATSADEKSLNGFFRSNVEKQLGGGSKRLVILDDLNCTKGFRYELWCLARTAKTPFCQLFCETGKEEAEALNLARESPYAPEVFSALNAKFERPLESNKGDSPLLSVAPEDELPKEELMHFLFEKGRKGAEAVSTKQEVKLDVNYAQKLDETVNALIEEALALLKCNQAGPKDKEVTLERAGKVARLKADLSVTRLKEIKLGFVKMNRQNPLKSVEDISAAFIFFLNSQADF